MQLHHIQRKILLKLLYATDLSYVDMRPLGIESNLFAYHLNQLIKAKYIAKKNRRYTLAPAGLAYIDRQSQGKMINRLQPHIVTVVDITTYDDKTLLFYRNFQPYIHQYGFILGKTHYEENVLQAALREVEEKSGLTHIPLTHRGIVYYDVKQDEFIITKVLCHIFQGKVTTELPTTRSHRGHCVWASPNDTSEEQLMPGFKEIKKLLVTTDPSTLFFDEFSFTI